MHPKKFDLVVDKMAKIIYPAFIRPHLEFASSVWNPSAQGDINRLEQVQRRATNANNLKHLSYDDRLQFFGFTTLKDRRLRGDLIQTYKIINGKDRVEFGNRPKEWDERGGAATRSRVDRVYIERELVKSKPRCNFLFNRVATAWNRLPTSVVNAPSVEAFKAGIDRTAQARTIRTSIYQT